MQKRPLGNSDLYITPTGFGAWAIGGAGWEFAWGHQDDRASIEAIHRAIDLGVNWIDTAAAYGLGHSEEVVARALETWPGPRPYVFSKCGLRADDLGNMYRVLKADSIRRECEGSLKRLRVDAIDLYQIHWPPDDNGSDLEEGWATMADLQREGKVRWIGVSNFDVYQMQRAQSVAPITSLQPPYSLINRDVELEVLPFCRREGIGVITYSPMASGLLTGRMTPERVVKLPADDWRRRSAEFNEPKLSLNLALVERLRAVGAKRGRSPGEVAIAWVLQQPAVTGAIVGARSAEQSEGVMRAGDLLLTEEDVAEIETENAIAASNSSGPTKSQERHL